MSENHIQFGAVNVFLKTTAQLTFAWGSIPTSEKTRQFRLINERLQEWAVRFTPTQATADGRPYGSLKVHCRTSSTYPYNHNGSVIVEITGTSHEGVAEMAKKLVRYVDRFCPGLTLDDGAA